MDIPLMWNCLVCYAWTQHRHPFLGLRSDVGTILSSLIAVAVDVDVCGVFMRQRRDKKEVAGAAESAQVEGLEVDIYSSDINQSKFEANAGSVLL
ncbi:GL24859 [Drosophila persimilis]|uniref:GL24859 n=1 Tax=Drosophila persimilis TaxID=7234 RepID=B4GRV8_DROPE|nr:GL24859 [Drosophila persimilis]